MPAHGKIVCLSFGIDGFMGGSISNHRGGQSEGANEQMNVCDPHHHRNDDAHERGQETVFSPAEGALRPVQMPLADVSEE